MSIRAHTINRPKRRDSGRVRGAAVRAALLLVFIAAGAAVAYAQGGTTPTATPTPT